MSELQQDGSPVPQSAPERLAGPRRYLKAVGSLANKDEVDTLVMAAFSNHRQTHAAVAAAQAPSA